MPAIEIAGLTLPQNVFLAPMAGYTNAPFRALCLEMGAGFTFTEMVSAKGLHYGNAETKLLLYGEERPRAAQLFGSDPAILREACESEALAPFDLIDLNMGCPMPKIVKGGDGSALMENLPLAERIVEACVKSGKRISVKMRTGVDEAHKNAVELAKRCEGAGAVMLTVHGRTRDKIYSGEPDFLTIAAVKNAVRIPVIANGSVSDPKSAEEMMRKTGADGVAVGRAALFDPRLFCAFSGREKPPMLPLFLRQSARTRALYGERFACVFLRKMAAFYIHGRRGCAAIKRRFFEANSSAEVEKLAEETFPVLFSE